MAGEGALGIALDFGDVKGSVTQSFEKTPVVSFRLVRGVTLDD
jgi:hypothetical protein